ncbi:tRNA-Val4 [Metabacillus sp. FJAT-53654]|uniref:tRNA-Val4 n=1 Tax=Metabacillus rhizosphaerae TaxID=3117747 RepID=A0ABZ2MNN2_9BACI
MKYSYEFKEDSFGDIGLVLPREISVFSDFIENISTEEQVDEYIGYIDAVLKRVHEDFEIALNEIIVFIKKDKTTVENPFLIDEPNRNTIETEEFKELLIMWRSKIPEIFKY